MQLEDIKVTSAVRVLNPKSLIVKDAEGETLFSHNAPVVRKNNDGTVHLDAVQWSRSKSTVGHVRMFLGKDREEITQEIMKPDGNYFLARLSAPAIELPEATA